MDMASFVNIIGGKREFPVRRSDPYERRGGDSRGSKERARGQRRRQRREEKNRQERERERERGRGSAPIMQCTADWGMHHDGLCAE